MRRLFGRAILLVPTLGIVAACGGSSSSTRTTPTTLPTVLTETFTGTLLKNSAYTHPFTVMVSGTCQDETEPASRSRRSTARDWGSTLTCM